MSPRVVDPLQIQISHRLLTQLYDLSPDPNASPIPLRLVSRSPSVSFALSVFLIDGHFKHFYLADGPDAEWECVRNLLAEREEALKTCLVGPIRVKCRVAASDAPPPYDGFIAMELRWDEGLEENEDEGVETEEDEDVEMVEVGSGLQRGGDLRRRQTSREMYDDGGDDGTQPLLPTAQVMRRLAGKMVKRRAPRDNRNDPLGDALSSGFSGLNLRSDERHQSNTGFSHEIEAPRPPRQANIEQRRPRSTQRQVEDGEHRHRQHQSRGLDNHRRMPTVGMYASVVNERRIKRRKWIQQIFGGPRVEVVRERRRG